MTRHIDTILFIGLIIPSILLCNQILATSSVSHYVINITCPDGWLKAMNNCYYFNNEDEVTWSEARTECNIMDADLMFIKNKEEMLWMNDQTEEYKTDEWWVGLTYTTRNVWSWVQAGGDISSINWRHEPDNYDEQDCCAINEFGLFSDEYCNSKLGFICELPLKRGQFCDTSSRWLMSDTKCYFISPLINASLHLSWNDAQDYCSNLVSGKTAQLLSISSLDEMTTLNSLIHTYDTSGVLLPWWTGMNDLVAEGQYFWQNGSKVNMTYIKWDQAPSLDRSKHRNCGVMYQGGVIDDMTCDKRAHYVCEKTAYTGYFDVGCGPWMRAGSKCYLMSPGDGYTWAQARAACIRANAQLIQVDNLDEMFWLQTLYLHGNGFWTGLSKTSSTGSWLWADGSIPDHNLVMWAQEPNNYQGNENCASIYRLGYYNDMNCNSKLGYICEYTKTPGVNCTPGWLSRGLSSCYYISPANKSYAVTWFEAKDRCNDLVASFNLVAYRLAVNDKDEQAWLEKQLLKQPAGAPWYWIGLNDRKFEGVWQYDEDFNNPPNKKVINWAIEPNNMNGNEDCAMVYDGGFFNDVNCAYKSHFICERPLYADASQSQQSGSQGKRHVKWLLLVVIFFCRVLKVCFLTL